MRGKKFVKEKDYVARRSQQQHANGGKPLELPPGGLMSKAHFAPFVLGKSGERNEAEAEERSETGGPPDSSTSTRHGLTVELSGAHADV
jgi:hypothetical protein